MSRSSIELSEYERRRFPAPAPSAEDRRLADSLGGGDGGARLGVRWLLDDNIELETTSWVGVVRFPSVDVHITPKYVGGGLRLLEMLDYTRRTNLARQLDNTRTLNAQGEHLHEILCGLLAQQAAGLLRHGLLRSYRSESDELPVLRGRLDHRAQYLRRYGQLDRLHCTFDEYDTDNAENQLIGGALAVARTMVADPELQRSLTQLRAVFDEACTPPTRNPAWYKQRITYGRLNARYRPVHDLCYLILEHTAFDDLYDTEGKLDVRSFLLNMNNLFEEFVTALLRDALRGTDIEVAPKERLRATILDVQRGRTYATLVPDLVLARRTARGITGRPTPVDVKYKLYDNRKLGAGDIYQSFTYAIALSTTDTDARGGIVYPGDRTEVMGQLDINPAAGPTRARITAASLGVSQILDQIAIHGALPDAVKEQVRSVVERITADSAPRQSQAAAPISTGRALAARSASVSRLDRTE